MKTFKLNEHSVFPRPFGLRGQQYLAIGVLVYFDLTDGGTLYTEQEMWKAVPDQLGALPILDQGMPKPRGEVLAVGSCFAPKGGERPASTVRIRVGDIEKTLNVYGDRYWKNGTITRAEPFREMPVTWENAFGGQGSSVNPKGKGMAKIVLPDGSEALPLPNLELPGQQIGSPGDRPAPGCFDQLFPEHPMRLAKAGTYDGKWKEERWPHFPDDMNYEYFNAASEDQFLEGFFQGDEPVVVEHMHPDMPLIEGALPSLRMRVFATLNPQYKLHQFPTGPLPSQEPRETDEFREVSTRLETVWLFPSLLRGVAIYRGTTEIMDEEAMDVPRILVRHEDPNEPPETIEHYRDLQLQLLSRGVVTDMSPFEAAVEKAKEGMLKVKNIPKVVDAAKKKALGQSPKMPMPTPEEMLEQSQTQLAEHSARLDGLEAMARGMQAEHGHQVAIDLTVFDKARAKMAAAGERIERATARIAEKQAQLETRRAAIVKGAAEKMQGLDPKLLARAGVDIDALMPGDNFPFEKTGAPWHEAGFPLVVAARKALDREDEAGKAVKSLRLKRGTVKSSWMGWNVQAVSMLPAEWGLDDGDPFTIPQGLVLPGFDGSVLNRMRVFPTPVDPSRSVLVPGSDETPLFLQSATLIDLPSLPAAEGAPLVIVPDELQALYVEQAVGDCVSVLGMRSPDEIPGDDGAAALDTAEPLLVVMPHGWSSDADAKAAMTAWSQAFERAEPIELEQGATVFQAMDAGADIRTWIFEKLPADVVADNDVAIPLPEPGKPPSKDFMKGFKPPALPDIGAIVQGIMAEVKASMEADMAPLKEKQAALMEQVADKVKSLDLKGAKVDIPEISMDFKSGSPKTPQAIVDKATASLDAAKARLRKRNQLTPEIEGKIDDGLAKFKEIAQKNQAISDDLNAQLADKTKELEAGLQQVRNMELPDNAKAAFERQGMDPDKLRAITREDVQRFYDKGVSLSGYVLTGLDLSEMDLSGADFTGCRMEKTNFSKSTLDRAIFVQCLGKEADFSGASLREAGMERSVYPKAIFDKADMTGARLKQAALKEASFKETVLAGADLDMAVIDKIDATKADFKGANLFMSLVGGDVSEADFRKARVRKCLFKEAVVDKADFRGATLSETLFNGAEGADVTFAGAAMQRFRTGNNTVLRGADFSGADLSDAAMREADFSEADFRDTVLDRAVFADSQLVRANLNGAVAKATRFAKANLEAASLRGVNLYTGSMRKARLVNADLRGSNCYAVNFYKAVMGKTRFEGANLDKTQIKDRLDLLDEEA